MSLKKSRAVCFRFCSVSICCFHLLNWMGIMGIDQPFDVTSMVCQWCHKHCGPTGHPLRCFSRWFEDLLQFGHPQLRVADSREFASGRKRLHRNSGCHDLRIPMTGWKNGKTNAFPSGFRMFHGVNLPWITVKGLQLNMLKPSLRVCAQDRGWPSFEWGWLIRVPPWVTDWFSNISNTIK